MNNGNYKSITSLKSKAGASVTSKPGCIAEALIGFGSLSVNDDEADWKEEVVCILKACSIIYSLSKVHEDAG